MLHGGTWLAGPKAFLHVARSIAMSHVRTRSVPRLRQSLRKGTCCCFGRISLAGQSLCTDGTVSLTAVTGLGWVICGLGH